MLCEGASPPSLHTCSWRRSHQLSLFTALLSTMLVPLPNVPQLQAQPLLCDAEMGTQRKTFSRLPYFSLILTYYERACFQHEILQKYPTDSIKSTNMCFAFLREKPSLYSQRTHKELLSVKIQRTLQDRVKKGTLPALTIQVMNSIVQGFKVECCGVRRRLDDYKISEREKESRDNSY